MNTEVCIKLKRFLAVAVMVLMRDFIKIAAQDEVSKHKMLIFWNHGAGTLGGFGIDEITGNMIPMDGIRKAFEEAVPADADNPPLDADWEKYNMFKDINSASASYKNLYGVLLQKGMYDITKMEDNPVWVDGEYLCTELPEELEDEVSEI